jgi:hypothetical protein
MYLISFPLLLIPFALYNMIAFLLNMPLTETAFTLPLVGNRRMPVNIGDLLVALAMLLLYVEVLKAARWRAKAAMDHALAFILLAAIAAELVLVPAAATSTLLLMAVLSFVDFIIGLSLISRSGTRDIVVEAPDHPAA